MKKFVVLMMLVAFANISKVIASEKKDSSEPKKIEIHKNDFTSPEYERSLDYFTIEAVLYSENNLVEVSLYNIGDAEVYIINSQNQVINSSIVKTDTYNIVNLNVDGTTSGIYYLIIISEKCYAEGQFTL